MTIRQLPQSIDQPHHHWGPHRQPNGQMRFRVFAPNASSVEMEMLPAQLAVQWMADIADEPNGNARIALGQFQSSVQQHILKNCGNGWFEIELPDIRQGTLYQFRVDGGSPRPDPASRFQPLGVHGWSQVSTGDDFQWNDSGWKGVPKSELVIYEMHVGAFTREGTYLAAIDRLDEMIDLGITAIELMPIAQCAGRWNWGYDGVDLFAPAFAYGDPNDLRTFIDAAHSKGLAVFLDVVYNHVGPEGNYFRDFGDYISPHRNTVWGDSFNIDLGNNENGPQSGDTEGDCCAEIIVKSVREFLVANVTYWLEEFHFDGLRLDAIHCINDDSSTHIVDWISRAFSEIETKRKTTLHLIAESNVYDSGLLRPLDQSGYGFDSLWCDDFLHSVFAVVRPGEDMSHRTYSSDEDLDTTLRRGYVYEGSLQSHPKRISLSNQPDPVDLPSLIFAIQNHDFIGNHPLGQRFHQLTSPELQRSAAALMLLYPATPMLFMGEEFATDSPFYFFTDFSDDNIKRVLVEGRKREYPQHDWSGGVSPIEESAFMESFIGERKINQTLEWYKRCLTLRSKLKNQGLLNTACLDSQFCSQMHVATLKYQDPNQLTRRFVVHCRLHPANEPPAEIVLSSSPDYEVLLSQNANISKDSIQLQPAGVTVLSENLDLS